ncbi:MAG: nucleotidyltransferase domain-containing protein [Phycisphaerales bacterium]
MPAHPPSAADVPDVRAQLIRRLTDALRAKPWALAAWLGGSDATGRTDRWSDIDLVLVVEDNAVEPAFATAKATLEALAPIQLELRLPTPTWHGHDQAFWQLADVPDWCMVDFVVIRRSSTASWFLEAERHGTPHVLFDPHALAKPVPLDRARHDAAVRGRLDALVPRFRLLQHLVRKAVWRGDAVEAIDRYVAFTLKPLVEIARIRYCPDRFDYGLRYLRDDLPRGLYEDLAAISLPGDLDAVETFQRKAEALFERELAGLGASTAPAPSPASR